MKGKTNQMLLLGRRIKRARQQAGLTQEMLAERIGLSRTAISRFELGEIEPNIRNLAALSSALGVSSDYLLGLDTPAAGILPDLTPEALSALQELIRALQAKPGNK